MASGQVTINNVVEYLGLLTQVGKRPNMVLRMLGGLNSVLDSTSREFPVGVTYDLRSPAQPAILEGAAAPTAQYRTLTQTKNVVQIFHEKVSTSYLAQSDRSISGVVSIPTGAAQGSPIDPRSPEWQIMRALETIAQDANYSFLRGTYVNPADPAGTALKTRGIHTAISTNVIDHSGAGTPSASTYRAYIEALVALVVTANGYNPDSTWALFADATEYNNIQAAYESTVTNFKAASETVAGFQIRQIFTRMGMLNIILEPDMPAHFVDLVNLGVCNIVGLGVPGKGYLFEEPLYKAGSSNETQIYGQLGVDHGPEFCHGSLQVAAVTL